MHLQKYNTIKESRRLEEFWDKLSMFRKTDEDLVCMLDQQI